MTLCACFCNCQSCVVKERKALKEKIENQCKSFDGKGKLTVDDLYNVIKVQVRLFLNNYDHIYSLSIQMKVDVSKDEIRKAIVDLPMDKNYKISCQVQIK